MTSPGRLILSGVISAAIHAYIITAAEPRIDPPRLEPPSRISLTVIRTSPPAPRSEPQPNHEPHEPKADPDPNTRPPKSRITAAKIEKPEKTPKRARTEPKPPKRKAKRQAKTPPPARKHGDKKSASDTKNRPSPANKPAAADPKPKAAGGKIRKPIPRANPRPPYPRSARRRGLEGTVTLEVLVDARGRVEQCRGHQSSGHRILDEQALKTVRKWTFEPGSKGGTPSAMWVKVPIRFELM